MKRTQRTCEICGSEDAVARAEYDGTDLCDECYADLEAEVESKAGNGSVAVAG